MQDLMKQIIEMDRKARQITEAAQREKVDSGKEIQKSRDEIRQKYLAEARRRIAANEPKERAAAEAVWEEKKKRSEENSNHLDQLYRENGDRWVEQIVARVLGE
jgi:galactokinase/mevalonate kinase-like predicted kinase